VILIEIVETVELPEGYGDRGRLLRRIYEEREHVDKPTERDREAKERMWSIYDPFWDALWKEHHDG